MADYILAIDQGTTSRAVLPVVPWSMARM
jgi:glycerol kinase